MNYCEIKLLDIANGNHSYRPDRNAASDISLLTLRSALVDDWEKQKKIVGMKQTPVLTALSWLVLSLDRSDKFSSKIYLTFSFSVL